MEHFLSNLSDLIAQNGATVVGVIVAFFMALFRTAQMHGHIHPILAEQKRDQKTLQ